MPAKYIMSHNYAYVSNPGGVADVAQNLSEAFKNYLPSFHEVFPSKSRSKARTFHRFASEITLELRHWREDVVLIFPNYFAFPLPGSSTRDIVVVHDLQYRSFPQFHSLPKRLLLETSHRLAKSRAAGIVFISKATENDFSRFFGLPRKHRVILNPVTVRDLRAIDVSLARAIGSSPYAIANFHHYPHKNIEKLLSFFRQIRLQCPELKLVLTGRHSQIGSLLRQFGLDDGSVVVSGFLPKNMVLQLVAGAAFFISLSLFEGFNMAAAEAAKLGRPLLLSDIAVHRELFDDFAFFVDPHTTEFPVNRFNEYLRVPRSKGDWKFSDATEPEAVAAQYADFFDEVLAEGGSNNSFASSFPRGSR